MEKHYLQKSINWLLNGTLFPSDKKGELAGYAFGKHGADILAPGAIVKIASKSAKTAQELTAVFKNLQRAEGTLVLETAAGVGDIARIGEIISAGRANVFLGEELGFTAKEMGQLKQAGTLEKVINNAYECISKDSVKNQSLTRSRDLVGLLKPHQGIYMLEVEVRGILYKHGVPTFPRPKGIPEGYRVKLSEKGGGMKYVHPKDEGTYIRVMPGMPHSINPSQQKPYVNHRINGRSVDKFGNFVPNKSAESHISLEEFVYRNMSHYE